MKLKGAAALLCALTLLSVGCGKNADPLLNISSPTYGYEAGLLVDPAAVTAVDIAETDENTVDEIYADGTVFWVKSGKVWHIKRSCSTLSRSKDILSGTVEDAMNSGKERVCKRCQN